MLRRDVVMDLFASSHYLWLYHHKVPLENSTTPSQGIRIKMQNEINTKTI